MFSFIQKLFDSNSKTVQSFQQIIAEINRLEPEVASLEPAEFKEKTQVFKAKLAAGSTLDDILPEAFALTREAAMRTLRMRHYDVQLMAALAFHKGMVGEQRTGEGKTLSATPALYLNALMGKGAHLVTVNDYLAQRDAGWNAPLYDYLGLSVGVIVHDMAYRYDPEYQGVNRDDSRLEKLRPVSRAEAYGADITYGTSNEFGFDYLRDNMAQTQERVVQRGHFYAIVDEVDSILIDEARTPLIISGPDETPTDRYVKFRDLISGLELERDYEVDEKYRTVNLNEGGIKRLEKMLGVENLYEQDYQAIHHIEQALKAKSLFHRDKEYVVKDDQIIIVDEHTGRLMFGRRYSDGLHQAIEAKEGVEIQRESRTLATISIQNYFRMYQKLAGMTGTAETEAEEFQKIYNMDVLVIPTHRPVRRTDYPDVVYKTTRAKYAAIVKEVADANQKGQPVLLGTRSIEHNEILSKYLKKKGIAHQILNAKNHEREAQIIADAGKPHAVTVATNIAGRGVDIVLGGSPPDSDATDKEREAWEQRHQQVVELGGLYVLGTERHESRRIDNQLRGRSGRQGDPGASKFFVALDDEIMRIFGGAAIARLMTALKIPEDQPIEANMVSRSIANAQGKVEGLYFDQRKHTVEYDDVLNKQRQIIYSRRNRVLSWSPNSDADVILDKAKETITSILEHACVAQPILAEVELEPLLREIFPESLLSTKNLASKVKNANSLDEAKELINKKVQLAFKKATASMPPAALAEVARLISLRAIDELWIEHLDTIDDLRQGIGLRGSQEIALAEYKKEAFEMFEVLLANIEATLAKRLFKVKIEVVSATPTIDLSATAAIKEIESFAEEMVEQAQMAELIPESAPKDEVSKPTIAAPQPTNPFAAALAKTATSTPTSSPTIPTNNNKIGRNDPCPCGSGKKWKKCGMIQAPQHRQ